MRFTTRIAAVVIASAAVALTACVPEPPAAPLYEGEPCDAGAGVTVVVDFAEFDGTIKVGCAEGDQASGFDALTNAGFAYTGGNPGELCAIDGDPAQLPFGCFGEGFWAYWDTAPAGAWKFSDVGVGDGPISTDSLRGFTWGPAPSYSASTPGVSPADVGHVATINN